MIKEQNQGLAAELGGFLFKPRLNQTSLDLSATMRSLELRMPDMLAERKKFLESKRKEAEEAEVVECTFSPRRNGSKRSEKLLHKMGRRKLSPEDLFQYEYERHQRIALRKQIMTEIENKELTFKPTISEKSVRLQEKLIKEGMLERDHITKTAINSPFAKAPVSTRATSFRQQQPPTPGPGGMDTTNSTTATTGPYAPGPMLVIESEHPYRHNTNEYTTVLIPGALSYSITFDENTKTELIHDYLKFFDDDTHTEYFGCGKYSGGALGSTRNWPGVEGRPALNIPASKFILHFKTNGSVNDWGFRMFIVPMMLLNPTQGKL